jgi:hypothetical protein
LSLLWNIHLSLSLSLFFPSSLSSSKTQYEEKPTDWLNFVFSLTTISRETWEEQSQLLQAVLNKC